MSLWFLQSVVCDRACAAFTSTGQRSLQILMVTGGVGAFSMLLWDVTRMKPIGCCRKLEPPQKLVARCDECSDAYVDNTELH